MKFLFLSSYAHLALNPGSSRVSGGAELQVALLAKALVRRGHEVVVVGGEIGQGDGVVWDGVRTRTGRRFQTGKLVDTVLAVPRVYRVLAEEKPNYVFVLGWTTWLYFLHLFRKVLPFRLGFICGLDTEVNGEFRRENPIRGALFERGVVRSDVRFAMTEYQASQFAKGGLHCGLYRNLILPRAVPRTLPKEVDLLWVARCQKIKQPHLFLDLAEQLPEVRCEMICPREDVSLWESVAARAATLPNVIFKERVSYHEIQSRYDVARIFVNTSIAEGWPNSFIQSGLGSTALLSLSVNPDGLFDRYSLGVFAENDFRKLLSGARAMLDDTVMLEGMQVACERFVSELHNNEKNVNAFLEELSL